jgi:hypothetical protein
MVLMGDARLSGRGRLLQQSYKFATQQPRFPHTKILAHLCVHTIDHLPYLHLINS